MTKKRARISLLIDAVARSGMMPIREAAARLGVSEMTVRRDVAQSEGILKSLGGYVISETDRLAALVDTLLGPGGPPNKQPVNVHELLEYVVRLIEAEDLKKITFERDYDPGLPLIDLDRDQIVQALLNLVQNAATALDGQGRRRGPARARG